ncbi:non-homologous end joining protein Ku [Gephyromycinifex aptenodytis]|uniref:non-homologous end joining protein Ku n=1 Tax=Gephyromycinifex aptenodytis TaxID=2716227 RepID=UPI001447EE00|nr:Ku protein [Gephyromycinifex aptenodytis]
MRAMWKGAVSFGLVTVPVRLYSATESHDLQFRQVRKSDGSRIKYKRVAEADGEEVPYGEIGKGYETPDGRMVVLSDEDLAALPNRSSKEISVEKFVPADQVDLMLLDKSYYLEPDAASAKPYALLREALRDTDRMAVVTVSVRSRMTMAVLRVRQDVIVLQTLLWPDEIREADFATLHDVPEPKANEVKMAQLLVESMADEFEPNDYEDDYKAAVEALVASKVDGGEIAAAPEAEENAGQVVDLLAALQKSVERAKASRGAAKTGDEDSPQAEDEAEPPKKTAAQPAGKRAAAKKTVAKKSTTKKAAAKKSTAKSAASEGAKDGSGTGDKAEETAGGGTRKAG